MSWFVEELRPYKRPLEDLEHATMSDLRYEYRYVCEELKERFENACYSDLNAEREWWQGMSCYFERLERVHREYDMRRHVAEELRKRYENE